MHVRVRSPLPQSFQLSFIHVKRMYGENNYRRRGGGGTNRKPTDGRSQRGGGARRSHPRFRPRPTFPFYLILDYEATCCKDDVPNRKPEFPQSHMEIIEFPSVFYDVRPMREGKPPIKISEYQAYVKPVIHPKLTDFCTELTGITQDVVDKGDTFAVAYRGHYNWLAAQGKRFGFTMENAHEHVAIVTCGDWDQKTMFPRQMEHDFARLGKKYPYPTIYRQWINVQRPFKNEYPGFRGGMAKMLKHLCIPLEGRHHSGIDDCRNTAKILLSLLEDRQPCGITGSISLPLRYREGNQTLPPVTQTSGEEGPKVPPGFEHVKPQTSAPKPEEEVDGGSGEGDGETKAAGGGGTKKGGGGSKKESGRQTVSKEKKKKNKKR